MRCTTTIKMIAFGIGVTTPALGGNTSSGGGGDELRVVVDHVREAAVALVQRTVKRPARRPGDSGPHAWLVDHAESLIADLMQSPHEWTAEPAATCGFTTFEPKAKILFSFPTCRGQLEDRGAAARLLVHESAHHLGVEDEIRADAIADVAVRSWPESTLRCELHSSSNETVATANPVIRADGSWRGLRFGNSPFFAQLFFGIDAVDVTITKRENADAIEQILGQSVYRPADGSLFPGDFEISVDGARLSCRHKEL